MIMNLLRTLPFLATFLAFASAVEARRLYVVADIAPVQAIVAGVVGDAHIVDQLVSTDVSAHDFALRPSDILKLRKADLIVWLGPNSTPALAKLMAQPDFAAKSLALNALEVTQFIELRDAGHFGPDTEQHDHGHTYDPHSWLSPENGAAWAREIVTTLQALDPQNADTYAEKGAGLVDEIAASTAAAKSKLSAGEPVPYIQFHDAFGYFETYFQLQALGAATAGDEEDTSLGIMTKLRKELAKLPTSCVFVQNDQQARRAQPLLEIPGVRVGYLDALGRNIPAQEYTYPALLNSVADAFAACLFP